MENMSRLSKSSSSFIRSDETVFPEDCQSSYEDAMKATLSTLNIFHSTKSRLNKRLTLASTPTSDSWSCVEEKTLSNDSFDKSIVMNSCGLQKNLTDIEFQKSVENIERVNDIYCNIEKLWNSKIQNDIEASIKDFSVRIIQPSNISITVEKMKSVLCHLQNVVAERSKLKQVLRNNVCSDVWHINKEYHKSVVNFFVMASALVKNVQSLIAALENGKEFNHDEVKMLQKREMELLQLFYTHVDSLDELRSFVQQHSLG